LIPSHEYKEDKTDTELPTDIYGESLWKSNAFSSMRDAVRSPVLSSLTVPISSCAFESRDPFLLCQDLKKNGIPSTVHGGRPWIAKALQRLGEANPYNTATTTLWDPFVARANQENSVINLEDVLVITDQPL
jgi:hypothetical protein